MKKILVVGNWKLHGNKQKIEKFIKVVIKKLNKLSKIYDTEYCDIVISPPMIYLDRANKFLSNSKVLLGSQNVDINIVGSFTGETSADMLKDIGVKYVIVGHSERRILHKEENSIILKKFINVKKNKLIPILCIGENKFEKESKQTMNICIKQIDTIIKNLGVESLKNSVIAYEPVWAIGKNKSATSIEAQSIISCIRKYISTYSNKISENIVIQYGGSINTNNVKEFLIKPDIDGVLVGKCSIFDNDFVSIIESALKISVSKLKINKTTS